MLTPGTQTHTQNQVSMNNECCPTALIPLVQQKQGQWLSRFLPVSTFCVHFLHIAFLSQLKISLRLHN